LLVILHLLPVWSFTHIPSQDGPAHLDDAVITREYHHPDRPLYRQYYMLNPSLSPSWFGHLILAGLTAVLPLLAAEKVFVSAYVVLLAFGFRYAILAVRPDARWLAVLVFPFIHNRLLYLGFYAFCYSFAFFFIVVGYWMRHRDAFTIRRAAVLTVLFLLLYFWHPIGLVPACATLGILGLWFMSRDLLCRRGEGGLDLAWLWPVVKMRALLPFCAAVPAFVLLKLFLHGRETVVWQQLPWRSILFRLGTMFSLVSAHPVMTVLSIAFAGLILGAAAVVLRSRLVVRRLEPWDGLLLVALGLMLLYLFGPNTYIASPGGLKTGGFFRDRMNLFPWAALVLWLAAQRHSNRMRQVLRYGPIGLAALILAIHMVRSAQVNDYLREYLSAGEALAAQRTFLPISFNNDGVLPNGRRLAFKTDPFRHLSSYIAARRRTVSLANYEASSDTFPVMYRRELNPYAFLPVEGHLEGTPPHIDIRGYERRCGTRVDFVLIWAAPAGANRTSPDPVTRSLYEQLERHYELVFTSRPRALMHVYRRRSP
jgi:hypothetical protein